MKDALPGLASLGLTPSESRVYLAGLAAGALSAQELAKETGIKRPTVYHALSTLGQKGLVAKRKETGKVRFVMASPEHLKEALRAERDALKSREESVDTLIPLLKGFASGNDGKKVEATEYEGIEGVKAVIDEALYCRSKKWDIIAPVDNFLRSYDKDFAAYYLATRKRRGIKARTLWEHKETKRRLSSEDQELRNPRYMPESMQGKFKSMLILFDDKAAIISSFKKPSAVVVTSKEAHDLLSAFFEATWQISEPY